MDSLKRSRTEAYGFDLRLKSTRAKYSSSWVCFERELFSSARLRAISAFRWLVTWHEWNERTRLKWIDGSVHLTPAAAVRSAAPLCFQWNSIWAEPRIPLLCILIFCLIWASVVHVSFSMRHTVQPFETSRLRRWRRLRVVSRVHCDWFRAIASHSRAPLRILVRVTHS